MIGAVATRAIFPVGLALLVTQMNSVNYMVRNGSRILYGTPDDRVIDYSLRDIFFTLLGRPIAEVAYRFTDIILNMPATIKRLELDNKTLLPITNGKIPPQLSNLLFGSLIKPGKFSDIPYILRERDLAALKAKQVILESKSQRGFFAWLYRWNLKKINQEVASLEELIPHLEQRLTPMKHLEGLMKAGQITSSELGVIKKIIKTLEKRVTLFEDAKQPFSPQEAKKYFESLHKDSRFTAKYPETVEAIKNILTPENDKLFKWAATRYAVRGEGLGGRFSNTLTAINSFGEDLADWKDFRRWKIYSQIKQIDKVLIGDSHTLGLKEKPPQKLMALYRYMYQMVMRNGLDIPLFKNLLQAFPVQDPRRFSNAADRTQLKAFQQGISEKTNYLVSALYSKDSKAYQALIESKKFAAFRLFEQLNHEMVMPSLVKGKNLSLQAIDIFKRYSRYLGEAKTLTDLFQRSGMHIKVPLSIGLEILVYGLMGTYIDNKFVQPYQREVVKLRGDSREFVKPMFTGLGVGLLTYLLTYGLFKPTGYFWRFALSSTIGTATWVLSSIGMFLYRISKPRELPLKAKPIHRKPSLPQTLVARANPFRAQHRSNPQPFVPATLMMSPNSFQGVSQY